MSVTKYRVNYHMPNGNKPLNEHEEFIVRKGDQVTFSGTDKIFDVLNVRYDITMRFFDVFLGNA